MKREPPTEKSEKRGSERRRWARAAVDLPITLSLAGGKCEARIRDISRAGVCFFLDRPIPLMTVMQMHLDLRVPAGKRSIEAHGAVVRCERISKALDHYEIALFLNEMAEPDRRAIEEYVASLVGPGSAAQAGA